MVFVVTQNQQNQNHVTNHFTKIVEVALLKLIMCYSFLCFRFEIFETLGFF